MKNMLLTCRASCFGKHASDAHHKSNLHHFLDLLPLVSSEYNNIGASTIVVVDLRLCAETYCEYSYIHNYNETHYRIAGYFRGLKISRILHFEKNYNKIKQFIWLTP